jgi:hypothetical protein
MSIFMDNVACTGTESRLIDCIFDRHTADCVHSEDAGVRCQEGSYITFLEVASDVGNMKSLNNHGMP